MGWSVGFGCAAWYFEMARFTVLGPVRSLRGGRRFARRCSPIRPASPCQPCPGQACSRGPRMIESRADDPVHESR